MKKYIFTVRLEDKEIGLIEVEAESDMNNNDGMRLFLTQLSKDDTSGMFFWNGNILEKSDLRNITVSVNTVYMA